MSIYDTRFGLPQSVADYLNQALPDISGIFKLVQPDDSPESDTPDGDEGGLTPEQLKLLYPQNDSEFRGGGLFGDLDLSRSKTFIKDVYDEELGDFIPTKLIAYYNPTLGNYQTFEGKNINPMFSNTGTPGGLLEAGLKIAGLNRETVGAYIPGSIRGFYDTPMDFFKRQKNEPPGLTPQQKMGIASLSKTYQDIGQARDRDDKPDRGIGPGGSGSRRGAADIPDRDRSSYATDDTASFF
jgi:hypothetical protein